MNKGIKYGAGLIAIYLVVRNGRNFATAMNATAKGGGTLVKAFQGRG